ncbi:MAG: imidazole glycerol phosphate synthase subunit HisH [Bacteroidota bacterium]|jgi:glutamine amidotransferase
METVIIQYNAGNIQSVLYALERLGVNALVTDDSEKIKSASRVIFPGVGEASTAMQYLKERQLDQLIVSLKQPVLGICLGMQLMCAYSEENNTDCLGIFNEQVKQFKPDTISVKVPQMGWNTITHLQSSLFKGVDENSYAYFVHGYYASIGTHTIAQTNYILDYSSALHKDNFYGVQFHPEKSAKVGEQIIQNFLSI